MSSPEAAPIVENVTGDGKGVKRAPEEQPSGEQDVDRSSYPPAAKTVKSNPAAAAIASDNKGYATAVDSREREQDEVQDPKNAAGSTDSERVEAEALLSLGLSVGTRLEVMWLLEEDGKSNEKVGLKKNVATAYFVFWEIKHQFCLLFLPPTPIFRVKGRREARVCTFSCSCTDYDTVVL